MRKMKNLLMMILVVLVSGSCIEDEFGNIAGTWQYPPVTNVAFKTGPPPPFDECAPKITITFNKNLTGTLDKLCESELETDSFIYNIKGDQLTITFDQQASDNSIVISGIFTYIISGKELFITNEAGRIMVLTKE